MPRHCFRVRFLLSERSRLLVEAGERIVHSEGMVRILVRSGELPTPISNSPDVLLLGSGYETIGEAEDAGRRWMAAMQVALARVRVGADFGVLSKPGGVFTRAGLEWLRSMTGVDDDRPILQERLGLHVYPCDPHPRFARAGGALATVGHPGWRFEAALRSAIANHPSFNEREELAYHLFSASFFQRAADTRFLSLMMAVEALIQPEPRPDAVRAHVESLIAVTKAAGLEGSEASSILTLLGFLRNESISQAGRRLAGTLGSRIYADETPPRFFTNCYDMRSRLVHGLRPRPTAQEVDVRAAALEVFVADLLSGALRDDASIDAAGPPPEQ